MAEESLASSLMSKGRVAVWIILLGTFGLGAWGTLTGDQVLEVIKIIGTLWLGAEAGSKIPQ